MKPSLLFFTYANKSYELFVIPYIYFALSSTKNSCAEIILEDAESFLTENETGLSILEDLFPNRFLIRQSEIAESGKSYKPHVIRFMEQPRLNADYVYIGDIDIAIFEDVYELHKSLIERDGLPFSNIIRKGTEETSFPRLTGLHFCSYDKMYPLPDISDIDVDNRNDENVLYEIMYRKGFMVPLSFRERPICGIHISLNRDAIGRYSVNRGDIFSIGETFNWGINRYKTKFLMHMLNPDFTRLFFALSIEYRALLMVIEAAAKKSVTRLNRIAASYLVDKRFSSTAWNVDRVSLLTDAKEKLEQGDFGRAREVLHNIVNVWPDRFDGYILLAQVYVGLGEYEFARCALTHAEELTNAPKHLKEIEAIKTTISNIER